jgi:hypothetical protein
MRTSPASGSAPRSRSHGTRNTRPGDTGHGSRRRAMTRPCCRTTTRERPVLAGPQQRAAAGGRDVTGPDEPRAHPGERRPGGDPDRGKRFRRVLQVARDLRGHVPPVQGGDVRGVDRVQQVACPEDAGHGRAQGRVNHRALVPGVDLGAAGPGQLVIGDPVPAEDHGVAVEDAPLAAVQVLQLDGPDPVAPDDPADPGAPGDRDAEPEPPGEGNRRVRFRRRVLGGHQRRGAAGLPQRQHR